jgi:putative endonuclease
MFYVYILKSLKNHRHYIGYTNNLERRMVEHNAGQSKYTSLTRPFELIHQEIFQNKKDATRRELFLKTGQGRSWIKNNFG